MPRAYFSEVLGHSGLVAGMFEELGIGDFLDHATQQTPATPYPEKPRYATHTLVPVPSML